MPGGSSRCGGGGGGASRVRGRVGLGGRRERARTSTSWAPTSTRWVHPSAHPPTIPHLQHLMHRPVGIVHLHLCLRNNQPLLLRHRRQRATRVPGAHLARRKLWVGVHVGGGGGDELQRRVWVWEQGGREARGQRPRPPPPLPGRRPCQPTAHPLASHPPPAAAACAWGRPPRPSGSSYGACSAGACVQQGWWRQTQARWRWRRSGANVAHAAAPQLPPPTPRSLGEQRHVVLALLGGHAQRLHRDALPKLLPIEQRAAIARLPASHRA